jgi:hypothetical protein
MLTRIPLILAWQCPDGGADAIYGGYLRHGMRNLDVWLAQGVPEDLAAPSTSGSCRSMRRCPRGPVSVS